MQVSLGYNCWSCSLTWIGSPFCHNCTVVNVTEQCFYGCCKVHEMITVYYIIHILCAVEGLHVKMKW